MKPSNKIRELACRKTVLGTEPIPTAIEEAIIEFLDIQAVQKEEEKKKSKYVVWIAGSGSEWYSSEPLNTLEEAVEYEKNHSYGQDSRIYKTVDVVVKEG